MAELAVTDGMPPPSGLPDGDFHCTMADGGIRIDQADPRILISAPLLYEIADGSSPWARIKPPPSARFMASDPMPNWHGHGAMEGALLKIEGVNRTVIYRIGEYMPRVHGYVAEWPD